MAKKILIVAAILFAMLAIGILFNYINNDPAIFGGKSNATPETQKTDGQKTQAGLSKKLTKTKIVLFAPKQDDSVDYKTYSGNCLAGSKYFKRSNIYTCTSGDQVYDYCVGAKKEKTFLCGADLISQKGGFLVKTENVPTPDADAAGGSEPWAALVTLENGAICTPTGDAGPDIDGKIAGFYCGENKFILGEFTSGKIWTGKLAELQQNLEENTWTVKGAVNIVEIAEALQ